MLADTRRTRREIDTHTHTHTHRDPALLDKTKAAYARSPTGSIWAVLPLLLKRNTAFVKVSCVLLIFLPGPTHESARVTQGCEGCGWMV
jgi:hypothetical protein